MPSPRTAKQSLVLLLLRGDGAGAGLARAHDRCAPGAGAGEVVVRGQIGARGDAVEKTQRPFPLHHLLRLRATHAEVAKAGPEVAAGADPEKAIGLQNAGVQNEGRVLGASQTQKSVFKGTAWTPPRFVVQ